MPLERSHRRLRQQTRWIYRYHRKRADQMVELGHFAKLIVEEFKPTMKGFEERFKKRLDALEHSVGSLGSAAAHILRQERELAEQQMAVAHARLEYLEEIGIKKGDDDVGEPA